MQTNFYESNKGTIQFTFVDYNAKIFVYDPAYPISHKVVFMKDHTNQIWEEREYNGDGVFGGMNYFELLTKNNMSDVCYKRLKCTPAEMGMKLMLGKAKLIKKVNGKNEIVELKYPELCIEDERLWRNRRPDMALGEALNYTPCTEPLVPCECDYCLECE